MTQIDPQSTPPQPSGYTGAPQPGAYPGAGMPSKNLGWAIAAIFFFWPIAIYAFIQSGKVEPAWYRGDRAGAEAASNSTKKAGITAIVIGVVLWLLVVILNIVVFAKASNDLNNQLSNLPTN